MAAVAFKVTVDDKAMRRALRTLLLKLGSLEEPFAEAGEALLASTQERFHREVAPDGEPWRALTRRYVERPRRKGGRGGAAHPILFRTGRLFASLTYRTSATALEVGTNRKFPGAEYSALAIHQFGGTPDMAPGPAAIPARPVLGLSAEDEDALGRILTRYLTEAI
jgi:phage virion morphogenesis protein